MVASTYVRPWPCRARGKAEDWGEKETGREEGEEREPRCQLLSSNHTVHNQFRVVRAMSWRKNQPWSGTGSSWDSTWKKDQADDGSWPKSDLGAASSSAAPAKAAGLAMAARFAVHPHPSPPVFKAGDEVWQLYDVVKRGCHHWVDMSDQLGRSRSVGS